VIIGFELFVGLFLPGSNGWERDRESLYRQMGVWSTNNCFYLLVYLLAARLPGLQSRLEMFEQTGEMSFNMNL
jgi:hypothetical protein